jgi:hypothetical protein
MIEKADDDLGNHFDEVGKFAKFNDYISIWHLAGFMSEDELCNEKIDKLIDLLELQNLRMAFGKDYDTYSLACWKFIWERFAGVPESAIQKPDFDRSLSPIRQYELDGEKLTETRTGSLANFVYLNDVRQYFKNIQKTFGIDVPFPDLLNEGKNKRSQKSPIDEIGSVNARQFASKLGKAGASKRWGDHNALLKEACMVANKKWGDGESAWHNEMAEYLIGLPKFKALKERKLALMKKLVPIADKYGRTRGKKGIKKEKN